MFHLVETLTETLFLVSNNYLAIVTKLLIEIRLKVFTHFRSSGRDHAFLLKHVDDPALEGPADLFATLPDHFFCLLFILSKYFDQDCATTYFDGGK